jgi:ribosomal protein S27AE
MHRKLTTDPQKARARKAVSDAVRRGSLVKEPCERCGAATAEAHHADYAQPLKVRWLCKPCHDEEHRRLNRESRVGRGR